MSTEPQAPSQAGTVSSNRSVMLVLSYLGLLALIPFVVEKDDKEVRWHARHGIVLMVAEFVFFVGLGIVSVVLSMITHGFAALLFMFLYPLLGLGVLVLHIVLILKALKGERMVIPQVTPYVDKLGA